MFNCKDKEIQNLKSKIKEHEDCFKQHKKVMLALLDYLGLDTKFSKVVEFGFDENYNLGNKIVEKCEIVKKKKETKSNVKKSKSVKKIKSNKKNK